jgi:hypothetical protein
MDIPEGVNDGYSDKDIRTVDLLVSIISRKKTIAIKTIISAHKITPGILTLNGSRYCIMLDLCSIASVL